MSRRTVSVSLPRALADRLEAHAGSEGVTLSDILRRAIETYDKSLLSHVMAVFAARIHPNHSRWLPVAKDMTPVPSGYLVNASHYGLTREAATALLDLPVRAVASEADALARALKAKGVEEALACHTADFACALLALADAHERPPDPPRPPRPSSFEDHFDSMFGAAMPRVERKPSLAERMPAYIRRATVDCALSAGWACIATLASVDPVRWRTICLVLADAFRLKLNVLEKTTLQSLHRARISVGA